MERERQEPTLGKADLSDVNFRPRKHRGTQANRNSDSEVWLKIALAVIVVVLIVMGLIEWNAKRQAAAMTAELMRPMTPAEETRLEEQMLQWKKTMEAETAKEIAELQRHIWIDPQSAQHYAPRAPLRPGQRCIQGRRFERIEGGWRDIPKSPC
ncbi:hypothetical protein [Stenotrophomonas humi]